MDMSGTTEQTAFGLRRYISRDLLQTVKIGETWSLDYAARCADYNPVDSLVEFDGFGFDGRWLDGCWRWKRVRDGRVFTYTQEQCCRLIYSLVPNAAGSALYAAAPDLLEACKSVEQGLSLTGAHNCEWAKTLRAAITKATT